jgi:hypothetical protein
MAKRADPTARRHRREKTVIEQASRDVKPNVEPEDHRTQSPVTETGLPVEDQVKKEWDPRKGGLPTF